MSDSDDDKPLGHRTVVAAPEPVTLNVPAPAAAPASATAPAPAPAPAQPVSKSTEGPAKPTLQPKPARPVISDESEDDLPLARRQVIPGKTSAPPPMAKPLQQDPPSSRPQPQKGTGEASKLPGKRPSDSKHAIGPAKPIDEQQANAKQTARPGSKPVAKQSHDARDQAAGLAGKQASDAKQQAAVATKPAPMPSGAKREAGVSKGHEATKKLATHTVANGTAAKPEAGSKPARTGQPKPAAAAKASKGKAKATEAEGDSKKGSMKRERKEYDLPGQTKDTPPETDSGRKFYTSLREQRPNSEMARRWCLQHGLVAREEAEKLAQQLHVKLKSPTKAPAASRGKAAAAGSAGRASAAPPVKKRSGASQKSSQPPAKRRKSGGAHEDEGDDDDDDDDDFGVAPRKQAAQKVPERQINRVRGKDHPFSDDFESESDDEKPLAQRRK